MVLLPSNENIEINIYNKLQQIFLKYILKNQKNLNVDVETLKEK